MEHTHTPGFIVDSDNHFNIDIVTRAVTNANNKKLSLIQYDHNSERYSFDIDRYIEGHDILDCNRVQIHYINIASTNKAKYIGLYEVDDLKVHPDNDQKACFTWLISEQATRHDGLLCFLISFSCVKDNETLYRWNSAICNTITISQGINNNNAVTEVYADELLKWENYIVDNLDALEAELKNITIPAMVDERYIEREFATSEEVSSVFALNVDDVQLIDGLSTATNLKNGAGTGSIQQKGITYDKLITDYEPNMAAWVIAKNGNVAPTDVSVYLTALGNDTVPTSEQVVDILNNRKNDVNTVISNFRTLPSPYENYGIDSLIAGALAGYGLTSSSDLSNIVGKVGSASAILGAMNKAFSPGAFAGGVGCEAGDEGYPGDTVCSFAYGRNVKTKAICAIGVGKDLENLGDYSAMFGKGNLEYKLEGSDDDKGNQSLYLYNLKSAGGTVTGTGDSRVGITGVNKGTRSILAGNANWNGADNSAVFGNQNIIGEDRDDNPCYSNLIGNGLINFINGSSHCGILGSFCKILNSHTTHLFGRALLANGRYGKVVVGIFNDDKANTYFEVGNGTSDSDRKNAFEVLKDGRAKVQSAPTESDDVLRLNELSALTQEQVDLLF